MPSALRNLIHAVDEALRPYPPLHALTASIVYGTLTFGILSIVFLAIEKRLRRDTSRYKSPHFVNDILYTAFYQGGIYSVLIWAPLFALAAPKLPFLQLSLIRRLPPLASIVVYWLTLDFLGYWMHRLQHSSKMLWAFHSVHHTQTRMTCLTSNRNHVVEQIYVNCIMLAPTLILGIPATRWMPLYFAQVFFELAQHAQVRWAYGPLHRLLVSPAFHAMHHSTRADEHDGNYGKILSTWDVVFGTFVRSDAEPLRYGVEGMDVRETLTAQFTHPFRVLASPPPEPAVSAGPRESAAAP